MQLHALPFSGAEKSVGIISLSRLAARVNQERPKVIFRHDDRISCIHSIVFSIFPLVPLFISRRKSSPFPSLFRSFSLIKLVYGHREPHRSCGLVNS